MKATHIKWDTDGDLELLYTLPEEIEIPDGMIEEDDISDWLSDQTGFCHGGFELVKELSKVNDEKLDIPEHHNSFKLSRKIFDVLSRYDDDERREQEETELYNELSQISGSSIIRTVLYKLCEKDGELKEQHVKASLIDGVTTCCGFDFGTDARKANYCPRCGKKLEVTNAKQRG